MRKENVSQIPEVEKKLYIGSRMMRNENILQKLRKENISQIPEVKKGKYNSNPRSLEGKHISVHLMDRERMISDLIA